MNDSTSMIPVPPKPDAVRALVMHKGTYSTPRLTQLSQPELERLQRQWYEQARGLNLFIILKLIIGQVGTLDSSQARNVWRYETDTQQQIEAALDAQRNTVMVRVNGHLVAFDGEPGSELFIPGQWVYAVLGFFERIELEKARRVEAREDRERQELITVLGINV